jgi:ubiquinone/menaquinone biosynthesis C-methylase UbiE
LIYVNPRPTKEGMGKFYPTDYYGKQNPMAKFALKFLRYKNVWKIIGFKKRGRILDVGCGNGRSLLDFKERGWKVYGVDISETAYKLAREVLGQNAFCSELKDYHFPDGYFDAVTLNHVFEHLFNPNEELKEIHRILNNEGIVFIAVPDIDCMQFKLCLDSWFHLDLPRHLFHYSSKTVKDILEKNGFRVISITHPLLEFPLDLFYSLKTKYLINRSKLLAIFLFLPLIAISLLKLFPSWRASIQIIAQKV